MKGLVAGILAAVFMAGTSTADEAGREFLLERSELHPPATRLRARFIQEKKLRILRDVLRSEGAITVDRSRKSVVWEVGNPEPARVVVRRDGLHVDGERRAETSSAWIETMAALLTGVSPDLERYFEVQVTGPDSLRLTPRESRLGEYFTSVELDLEEGQTLPLRIRWVEPGGDVTTIGLEDVEVDPEIDAKELEP